MAQENAKFWNWLEDKPKGGKKVKQADALSFDATMDNGQRTRGQDFGRRNIASRMNHDGAFYDKNELKPPRLSI